MSKFAIYRSKGYSLHKIAVLNTTINIFYALVLPFIGFAGIFSNKLHISDKVIFASLVLWLVIIFFLNFVARIINKNLEPFGDLTITKSGITKTIAGIVESFEFKEIKEIELKRHIRTYFFPSNASGIKTYLVTMVTNNALKKRFVISGQSIERPIIELTTTLNTIKKITGNKIKIKNKATRMF